MNFLDAVISEKGGNVIATIGGEHEVIVPAAKAKVLKDKGYVGKKLFLVSVLRISMILECSLRHLQANQ